MVDPRSCGARFVLFVAAAGLLASCGGGQSSSNGIQGGGNGRVINNGQGSGFDAGAPPSDGGGSDAPVSAVGAACATCETQKCDPGPAYGTTAGNGGVPDGGLNEAGVSFVENIAGYADYYGSCYRAVGTAKTGPAAGESLAQLCIAVLNCVHRTGCGVAADGTYIGDSCYCGKGVDPLTCTSDATGAKATGPCKHEIEAAAQSVNPLVIAMDLPDPSTAPGAALGLIYWCDSRDPFINTGGSIASSPCASYCAGQASFGGSSGSGTAGTTGGGGSAAGAGGHAGTGGAVATGGSGGAGQNSGGAAGQAAPIPQLSPDCEACQLDPSNPAGYNGSCALEYITAQQDVTMTPVEGTWGCSSLSTAAARTACDKLVACIVTNKCSSGSNDAKMAGDWPNIGCYCGAAPDGTTDKTDCISGTALYGPCVKEYQAAASADPKFPGGDPGAFIGTNSFEPTTVVGLADNLVQCAIDSSCTTCFNLVTAAGGTGGGSGNGGGPGVGGGGNGGVVTATGGSGGHGGLADGGSGGTAIGGAGGLAGGGGHAMAGAEGGGSGGSMVATCPDLNHDAVSDCSQTLVANSDFKQTATHWTPDTNATIQWTALNGTPGTGSGSMEVENSGTTATDSSGFSRQGAWQCVPVAETLSYLIEVQAYMPSGQRSGWAEFDLGFYSTLDCTGADTGRDFVSPQGLATDSWMTLTGSTQIPLGIKSVALRLLAVKPATGAPLKVDFDNALFIAD